jgi:5-methylcytosine-specific restriction endonuclease McrA
VKKKTIYDKEWYRFRKEYLSKPENQDCAICGKSVWSDRSAKGRLLPPELDHKVRLKDGGSKYDLSNLQPLCHSCHSIKRAYEKVGQPFRYKGCDVSGTPLDPNHHWNIASK